MVVDATDREDGDALTAADFEQRLPRALRERDIVLVHSGRDAFYGEPDYIARGPASPQRRPAGSTTKACG